MRRKLTELYLLGMAVIFPLVIHHTYFDILETKHYFFVFWTMGAALSLSVAGLFQKTGRPSGLPGEKTEGKANERISRPVMAAGIILLFLALCSTLLSPAMPDGIRDF